MTSFILFEEMLVKILKFKIPFFFATPFNIVDTNGSLCNRKVAVVGLIVAHNGEFCDLIYLLDCIHISLVSALSMMSPKIK